MSSSDIPVCIQQLDLEHARKKGMIRQIVYCHVVQFAIQRRVFPWLAGWRGLTANMRPSGGREYHYGLHTAAIPAQPDGCRLRWLALSGGEEQASGGSPCRYLPGTSPSQCDKDTCRLERLDHNVAGTDITVERSTRLVENTPLRRGSSGLVTIY